MVEDLVSANHNFQKSNEELLITISLKYKHVLNSMYRDQLGGQLFICNRLTMITGDLQIRVKWYLVLLRDEAVPMGMINLFEIEKSNYFMLHFYLWGIGSPKLELVMRKCWSLWNSYVWLKDSEEKKQIKVNSATSFNCMQDAVGVSNMYLIQLNSKGAGFC